MHMPSILPKHHRCVCVRPVVSCSTRNVLRTAERSAPRLQRGRSRHKMSQKRSFGQLDLVVTKRKKQRAAAVAVRTFKNAPKRSIVGQVYKYVRKAHGLYPIGLGGWSNLGNDMTFTTALGSASVNVSGSLYSSVAIPNVSEFTNLYEQFRVPKIRLRFWLSQNYSNTGAVANPLLHICNDFNSTGSFTLNDLEQHQDMRTYQLMPGKPIVWDVYPHMRIDVLQDSGITSSSAYNIKSGWVDTSSPNTQLLGTRIWLNMMGQTQAYAPPYQYVYMEFEYYFEFKGVK